MLTDGKHVVLGGNGVAGLEIVKALLARGEHVVSVGRQPSKIAGAFSVQADLRDAAAVARALAGAAVAYLVAGVPYTAKAWAEQWPSIMHNTICAAETTNAHLIFLDNVYAYGRVSGEMSERTTIAPVTKKGRVRAELLDMLASARSRGVGATIGRSADFYGPHASTSVFNTFVVDRIGVGKRPTWFFDADQPHSMTYTPDIGRALAALGTAPHAWGRTWHLPTAEALTGRQWVQLAARDEHASLSVMRRGAMQLGALFAPAARETLEMDYQFTAPYRFGSSAFEDAFEFAPTPPDDGVAATLEAART